MAIKIGKWKELFGYAERRISHIAIAGTALLCVYFLVTKKWEGDRWRQNIHSDGKGYYAYLPAAFIYQDFQYEFEKDILPKYGAVEGDASFYCIEYEGKKVNKYFAGTALLILPFFLLACLLSWLLGFDLDGYSYLFQCSVSLAALFYLVLGLIFLRRLLLFFVSEKIAALTLVVIFWGTNLFYYTVFEASISHVYSFFAIAGFLLYAYCALYKGGRKNFLISIFFLALVILLRPSNGIILFVLPFVAGGFRSLWQGMRDLFRDKITVVLGMLTVLAVVAPQFILYKLQSGQFIVYSYGEEGFNLLQPEVMNVLFSYRKGLFVYTPILLISLLGFIPLWRMSRFRAISLFLFICLVIYVISSWWMWFYGGSYGQRAFVEYFPVFAVLMALLFAHLGKWFRLILLLPVLLLVCLNLVQTYQKFNHILLWDNMTKEKYWTIFLKTHIKWAGVFDTYNWDEGSPRQTIQFAHDLESAFDTAWKEQKTLTTERAYSGKYASKIGEENRHSMTFIKSLEFLPDSLSWSVKVSVRLWFESTDTDAELTIGLKRKGIAYAWHVMPVIRQSLKEKEWNLVVSKIALSELNNKEDEITVMVATRNDTPVFADDFEIKFLGY